MTVTTSSRSFRLVCTPEERPLVEELLRAQGYDFDPEPFSEWSRKITKEPKPLGSSLAAFLDSFTFRTDLQCCHRLC